jgi:hypothetical protein
MMLSFTVFSLCAGRQFAAGGGKEERSWPREETR